MDQAGLRRAPPCAETRQLLRVLLWLGAHPQIHRGLHRGGFSTHRPSDFPKPYTSGTRFLRYQHKCAHLLAKGEPKEPEHPTADVIQWTHYTGNKLHPSQKPLNVLLPLIRRTGAVWARAGQVGTITVRARYARFTKRTAARRAFRTC